MSQSPESGCTLLLSKKITNKKRVKLSTAVCGEWARHKWKVVQTGYKDISFSPGDNQCFPETELTPWRFSRVI